MECKPWSVCGRPINRRLLPLKFNYFVQFFVVASIMTYINPILAGFGLNPWRLAVCTMLANACGTVTRVFFGAVADTTQKHHLVTGGLSLSAFVSTLLYFAVPKNTEFLINGHWLTNDTFNATMFDLQLNNQSNATNAFRLCWPNSLTHCAMSAHYPTDSTNFELMSVGTASTWALYQSTHSAAYDTSISVTNDTEISAIRLVCDSQSLPKDANNSCVPLYNERPKQATVGIFVVLTLIRCFMAGTHAPVLNLMDSITYSILGPKQMAQFGQTRLYGSIGYVTCSLLTGYLISRGSGESDLESEPTHHVTHSVGPARLTDYTSALIMAAVSAFMGTVFSFISCVETTPKRLGFTRTVMLATTSIPMIKCLINALFPGLVISFIFHYSFLILATEFHVPHYFFGIMIAVQVMSEIPAYLISGWLIQRLGVTQCLVIAHLIWAVRLCVYASVARHQYWFILCAEALFGLSFTLTYNTILTQAAQASQRIHTTTTTSDTSSLLASMQAMATAMLFGVSSSVGGFVWGMLLERLDGSVLYYCVAALCVVTMGLIPLISVTIDKIDECMQNRRKHRCPPELNALSTCNAIKSS